MPTERPQLSVVVPLLNEAESLNDLVERLEETLRTLAKTSELIFVDDGSTDGSFDLLADLQRQGHPMTVLQLRRNYGKAAALAAGFREAQGSLIVTLDADLQDRPEEIPKLVAALEQGADLACGWRRERQDRPLKIFASRLYNRVTRWLGGVPLHDMNCGLKAFRREAIDGLNLHGELHRYMPVISAWHGFKVTEVPVTHAVRRHGVSKYGSERFLRGFLDLLTVMMLTRYRWRPLHLFGGIGLAMAAVGLCVNLYLAVGWAMGKWWLEDRPLLLLGVMLMIVGVQFVLFGLLAEMVASANSHEDGVAVRKRWHGTRRPD